MQHVLQKKTGLNYFNINILAIMPVESIGKSWLFFRDLMLFKFYGIKRYQTL